ncbi:MAG: hypothetical protein A2W19_12660 [Spirochaetes bacterium RBG_16_49_21]|nr:MAG: hypothetical protein A2W19_12660 [Spirochaetes bacterium RBG_16_49_21]
MKFRPPSINKAASGIDRLIGRMPYRAQESVKGMFYLFVFMLTVGGAVYGVIRGRDAAVIKSAPIIEHTNDTFELDIKRERNEGNFSSMLDSDMINEEKKSGLGKMEFPMRAHMEPEADKGIIEPDTQKKVKPSADIMTREPIFEDENRSKPVVSSNVDPVEKRSKALDDNETIVGAEQKQLRPVREKGRDVRGRYTERIDRKPGAKKRERGTDIRSPETPNNNNDGMIED